MVSLVIVANGKSVRFGENKLLSQIDKDILVCKTIKCFLNIAQITEIIVVCNNNLALKIVEKVKQTLIFVEGGATRTLSVAQGLEKVTNEKVLIHDGARPFVKKEMIEEIINCLNVHSVVIPTIKIVDCLKKIVDDNVKTLNRENYLLTQTPQGFDTHLIKEAYKNININWADDCQAIEDFDDKPKIKFINGDVDNVKITFMKDLKPSS